MARVTYGSIVTELRGKIGGTVFQRNKYGFTAKNSPCIIKPNTQSVFGVQRILNQVTQSWGALSAPDRLAYETWANTYPQYAKHNPTSQLSGYAVYVMYNCTRLNIGIGFGGLPESFSVVFPSISPTVSLIAGILSINVHESYEEPDAAWALFLSPPVRSSINFPPSTCRYIIFAGAGLNDQDITAKYLSQFGQLPAVGKTIFIKAIPIGILTPQVQAPQFYKIIIT